MRINRKLETFINLRQLRQIKDKDIKNIIFYCIIYLKFKRKSISKLFELFLCEQTRLPLTPDDLRWNFLPKDKNLKPDDKSDSTNSDSEGEETSAKAVSIVESPPGRWYYVSDSR